MHILRAIAIAFSIYSKIPVPQFAWKERDMRYTLCFFPWVGAVIGGIFALWNWLCGTFMVGNLCRVLIGGAIPIAVTGGFHLDGFLDTVDALCSYGSREKKLEILKDSHVGAFAVIMTAMYGLIYLGALSEVTDGRLLRIVCGGFFLSRCLSGIGVVSFPKARRDGTLRLFADNAHRRAVKGALYLQSACCAGFMLLQSFWAVPVIMAAFLSFIYYRCRAEKEFGGITGDTAGFFVVICEGSMMAAAAAVSVLAAGGLVSIG